MRTSEFKKYLRGQIKKYGDSQNKSIRLVMTVLTTSLIDLECYSLLWRDGCLKEFAQADTVYFKHCRRCCLIELWSVTEIRIREIVEERKIPVKGRNAAIRELISEARKINTNSQVEEKLIRAESKLKGKFIEFPNYQSAVLGVSKLTKDQKKDWRSFFDIFRIMRNSAHDNFTCTETRTLRWKGHTITFVEGESMDVKFSCLKRIIDELLKFFELIR